MRGLCARQDQCQAEGKESLTSVAALGLRPCVGPDLVPSACVESCVCGDAGLWAHIFCVSVGISPSSHGLETSTFHILIQ